MLIINCRPPAATASYGIHRKWYPYFWALVLVVMFRGFIVYPLVATMAFTACRPDRPNKGR